jgi:hypothetical protein
VLGDGTQHSTPTVEYLRHLAMTSRYNVSHWAVVSAQEAHDLAARIHQDLASCVPFSKRDEPVWHQPIQTYDPIGHL